MPTTSRPKKLGMNTDELKAFTEMSTTLRLSIEGLNSAISNLSSEMKSFRKDTSDRFDRIESRWDERLRAVEAKAVQYDVELDNNKEEIEKLRKKGGAFDLILGVMSVIGTYFGVIFGGGK